MKKQDIQKIDKKPKRIYGVLGLGALFLSGALVGFIINGSDRVNHSTMSLQDCNNIADKIMNAARNNHPDLIEQLNKVYSENCLNREFEQPKPQPKPEENKLPETTCEAIEELLKKELNEENTNNWEAHEWNAKVYYNLSKKGCDENRDEYAKLSQREVAIALALKDGYNDVKETTCDQIESLLTRRLYPSDSTDADAHIDNAKIYANLSERGCPENSGKYKNLAKQEIDIARALTDDNIEKNERESVEIVETYKRLQMQAEAAKMIEKAKKLTNPAIDFIIQLEKIIEE